jgi:hypothetical protein
MVDLWWAGVPALAGWSVWRARRGVRPPLGYRRVAPKTAPRVLWLAAGGTALALAVATIHPAGGLDAVTGVLLVVFGGIAGWWCVREAGSPRPWWYAAVPLLLALGWITIGGRW